MSDKVGPQCFLCNHFVGVCGLGAFPAMCDGTLIGLWFEDDDDDD
jgi:hypothetical protein